MLTFTRRTNTAGSAARGDACILENDHFPTDTCALGEQRVPRRGYGVATRRHPAMVASSALLECESARRSRRRNLSEPFPYLVGDLHRGLLHRVLSARQGPEEPWHAVHLQPAFTSPQPAANHDSHPLRPSSPSRVTGSHRWRSSRACSLQAQSRSTSAIRCARSTATCR